MRARGLPERPEQEARERDGLRPVSDQVERAQDQRELIPAGEKPADLAFPARRPVGPSGRTLWRGAIRSDRPQQTRMSLRASV
jgi:hypothetical protein